MSTCPSCNCKSECGCEAETATLKKPILERAYAKNLPVKDASNCDAVLLKKAGILLSDGKKVWFATGSDDDPIKLDNLQQLTDAFTLMGVSCDGIIGKVTSDSDTPKYLQLSSSGLSTVTDQRSDIIYDPSKVESTTQGPLAVWQCDGVSYRLSQLTPPDSAAGDCCTKQYYLVFDCKGSQSFVETITTLGDLIKTDTN